MPRIAGFVPAVIGWLIVTTLTAWADDRWKPVEPGLLASKTPVVEKDADAEVVFWEVRVDDAETDLKFNHYIRVKVFTDRGREQQSEIEIPFTDRMVISDIVGRTIKPDGSIVELKKDAIFERTAIKAGRLKVKVKSFAMPGVEPGSVIEYRYRETHIESLAQYVRLPFQKENMPVRQVTYFIKPSSYIPYQMRAQMFNGEYKEFKKEPDGFKSVTLTNLPAYREEPRMPPEDSVKMWMLIYYTDEGKFNPEKFWPEYGRKKFDEFKSALKVGDEVKAKAAELTAGATTPEQKLEKLFEFCRTGIKNVTDDASGMTAVDLEKLKANKTPADTLKRGMGTGQDIDMLFGALATAAGFTARLALVGDRGRMFFDPNFPDGYFLRGYNIAVQVGADWRFFDPASTHLPFGMLRWQEEGLPALITDPKNPVFVTTPITPMDKSRVTRTGIVRLKEDGSIEGNLKLEYTGHLAAGIRELYDDDSANERETDVRNRFQSLLGVGEITELKLDNLTDPSKPLVMSCHIKVPGYAERTGKRLFLRPALFQRSAKPIFATSERRNDVYFDYPWSEDDTVTVILPEGFTLENPEAPASFGMGGMGQYSVKLSVTTDNRNVIYRRTLSFGDTKILMLVPNKSYPVLKTVFDLVNKQDEHSLTLKQGTAAKQ